MFLHQIRLLITFTTLLHFISVIIVVTHYYDRNYLPPSHSLERTWDAPGFEIELSYPRPLISQPLDGTYLKEGLIGLIISIPKTLDDIEPAGYSALFLPGLDRSTRDQVMQDEGLLSLILEFDQEKKLIAAVCGSTVLLGRAGILKGKRFCSDVQTHPVFENAIQVQDSAIRDRHVITGLGARIFHFTALLIEALVGKEQSIEYQRWAGLQAL